jgi:D-lactate dehydrogenase
MKTLVYSAHGYEIPFLKTASEGKHDLDYTQRKLTIHTASLAAGYDAVALFTADDASANVLQKLSTGGIRYVALRSAGYDHVDLNKAEALDIPVANVPAYSPHAIAEHAVALLMALNRKICESQLLIQMQDFRLDTLVGFNIHGKKVGIVGTGTIGMAFAKIIKGFGATLIGFDPVHHPEANSIGLNYVSFDELLSSSDIISLHCPLNTLTNNMIANPQLDKMKATAILINTARGGVVNTSDLLDALENGRLGGACLDVYEHEKSFYFEDHRNDQIQDPLFARLRLNKKVMLTGHQAFLTNEALTGIAATTIANLDFWQRGEKSPNCLNNVAAFTNYKEASHCHLSML